jgi:protein ImuB
MTESWLAVELPHLALDLVTRGQTPGRELPVAVSDGDARRPAILDCNPAAKRLGVTPRLPLNAALALAEGLLLSARDRERETRALERLAAWSYQYSSTVAVQESRHTLLLEAGASRRLFGAPADLARHLAAELQQLGYHARTGVGPTPEAARLAARQGLNFDSREELHSALRDLPRSALLLTTDQHVSLERMGFERARDLLRLPRKSLARRLGPGLVDYLDRLQGRRPDPQATWRPPCRYMAQLELPAETRSSRALLFPLRRLLRELCGVLRGGDLGAQEIEVILELREGRERFCLGLREPTRDPEHFQRLLGERLERLRLSSPARAVELRAERLTPFDTRTEGLFGDGEGDADPLQPLLERLQARLGRDAVAGIGGVRDHRPEHSWTLGPPGEAGSCEPMPHRPLWLYGEPRRCRIEDYRVLAGPERIESGWWDGRDCRRDYYVVRDAQGSTLWAYREYKPRRGWYLQGLFG